MNSCEKIQEMISAMLDGELTKEEKAIVQEHIASCNECAAMYEDFAALSEELSDNLRNTPANLHEHIMDGIKAQIKPKKPIHVLMRPYMAAAACLIIVAGVALAAQAGKLGADSTFSSNSKMSLAETAAAPMALAEPAAPADPESYIMEDAATEEYGAVFEPEAPQPNWDAPAAIAPEAEPAAPAEPNDYADERQLWLGDYAAYVPGREIGEAYLTLWDDESGIAEQRIISDTALLTALLMDTPAEVAIEALPEKGDILAEIYCEGEYQPITLYFIGENVIVQTADSYYMAAGSAEDFLQIN